MKRLDINGFYPLAPVVTQEYGDGRWCIAHFHGLKLWHIFSWHDLDDHEASTEVIGRGFFTVGILET